MTNATNKLELLDLLEHFDTAMLVTKAASGRLAARPMHVVRTLATHELWFVTSIASGKVEEIQDDPEVLITMQSKHRYLSLSGKASISQDRELIAKLWKPAWKAWFPGGPEDPALALMRVEGEVADFWDLSATDRLRYLFQAGRAILQGRRVSDTVGVEAQRHVELS